MNRKVSLPENRTHSLKTPPAVWLWVLFSLCITALACGTSTTDELASALPPNAEEQSTPTQITDEQEPERLPTATQRVSPTEPLPTPTQEQLALEIEAQGFGQDDRRAGYGFVLVNPNANLAFMNTQYQVAAYDENNTVIETDSGYLTLLLPQQRLGVGGDLLLDEGDTVSRLEVQISEGDVEVTDVTASFEVSGATFSEGRSFSYVRGVITNPYTVDLTQLRASALVYDKSGAIIGGGYTFVNFALSQQQTGVEIGVTTSGDVAAVEIFPVTSGLSDFAGADPVPAGAAPLAIDKQGFGQDEDRAGVGLVVTNPNADYSIERTMYRTTLYGENDVVLSVVEGYLDVILPDQTLGIGDETILDEGVIVVRSDSQILAGRYETSKPLPGFTGENVTYRADRFFSTVTGEIVNPYGRDITNLRISAIAYDAEGNVIGGGYTFLDFVPAEGRAAAEVTVTTSTDPASVELYGVLSALSDIK